MLNSKRARKSLKHRHAEEGQGLVEYAMILLLVSVLVISILVLVGPQVGSTFSAVNSTLQGAPSALPSPTPCVNLPGGGNPCNPH
ncbi:MAG TPA: Flp family type IVb pilin [Chloroflexia bacterium]|nr:Flp family type IVb pilin [Chloroflexia bacterium]